MVLQSFAGGLTQTDFFNAPTVLASAAANGLSYNQACYTNNVGMRQAQKYQDSELHACRYADRWHGLVLYARRQFQPGLP
jgi:hypothetical protein